MVGWSVHTFLFDLSVDSLYQPHNQKFLKVHLRSDKAHARFYPAHQGLSSIPCDLRGVLQFCQQSFSSPGMHPLKSEKVVKALVIQSCLTLCDPMDWSLPGSSVYEVFQAIVLEWIAISFSRGSSQPKD